MRPITGAVTGMLACRSLAPCLAFLTAPILLGDDITFFATLVTQFVMCIICIMRKPLTFESLAHAWAKPLANWAALASDARRVELARNFRAAEVRVILFVLMLTNLLHWNAETFGAYVGFSIACNVVGLLLATLYVRRAARS